MLNRFRFPFLLVVIGMLVSIRLGAQDTKTEKRIYLVDLTASMEGKGRVWTPNIMSAVKKNLVDAINNIEDKNTEILIIPFTDKVHPQKTIKGRIHEKESILAKIKGLNVLPGDTNISGAWEYGVTQLDDQKINYLFLLTDGRHNYGDSMDALLDRLRAWGNLSKGKYLFAFYVMLTENARDRRIKEIANATPNMWVIDNMNLNTSLIKTSINQRINVFNNNTATISFSTNYKKADLSRLKFDLSLEKNAFYEIKDVSAKSSKGNSYSFTLVEKLPKLDMPIDTTLTLMFSYDTKNNPFIFFTPDRINLQILNQGPREVSVAVENSDQGLKNLDLDVLTYEEPFQGFFKWTRKIYEKTLDWKLVSWAVPDTARTTTRMILSWNDEAIRSHSSVMFHLSDTLNPFFDHIHVTSDHGDTPIVAKAGQPDTVCFSVTVTPGLPSTSFSGSIISLSDKLDFIDGKQLAGNESVDGEWHFTYKKGFPFLLWVLWSIPPLAIILLLFFSILFSVKRKRKKVSDRSISPSAGSLEDKSLIGNHAPKDVKGAGKGVLQLEKDYLTASSIHHKSISLYGLMVSLERLKATDPVAYEEAFSGLSDRVRSDLEKLKAASVGLGSIPQHVFHLPMEKKVTVSTPSGETVKTMDMLVEEYERDFSYRIPTEYVYEYGKLDLSPLAIAKVNVRYDDMILERYLTRETDEVLAVAAAELAKSSKIKKLMSKHGYSDLNAFMNGLDQNGCLIRETPLVLHDDPDCMTVYLVPAYIHDCIDHYGGMTMASIVM